MYEVNIDGLPGIPLDKETIYIHMGAEKAFSGTYIVNGKQNLAHIEVSGGKEVTHKSLLGVMKHELKNAENELSNFQFIGELFDANKITKRTTLVFLFVKTDWHVYISDN